MKFFSLTMLTILFSQSNLHADFYENRTNSEMIVQVQPDNIKLSQKGIYLDRGNGQNFLLQNLQSDGSSLYTVLSPQDEVKYTTYICPGCKVTYYWWQNCTTAGCPYSPNK